MDLRKLTFGDTSNPKRRWHHYLKNIHKLKIWQLVVIFVLLCFISATFLRLNNIEMLKLRDAVTAADEAGDDKVTFQKVKELRAYVLAHMNTDLGQRGVALQKSYERAVNKAISVNPDSDVDAKSDVQKQAGVTCRARFQGGTASYRNDYVACVMAEVEKLAPGSAAELNVPDPSPYYYNFEGPRWSPDLAGFSVLATGVVGLLIIGRIILEIVARLILKRRRIGVE